MKAAAASLALEFISPGEREAERIYELLREGRMGRHTFIFNVRSLELHSPIGGIYLRWLLLRSL
jgi:hypothetical protein